MNIIRLKFLFCFIIIAFPKLIVAQDNSYKINFGKLAIDEMMVDDYGNLYLQNHQNFSLTKMDSIGNQLGRLQLTIPFKIQPINNPMQIVLFSEQAQQVKIFDQYLTEIQRIDVKNIGYITAVYLEDQQIIWLMDEANRRVIRYNYRLDKIINSIMMYSDFQGINDFMVFNNQLFFLIGNRFEVYDFRMKKIFSKVLDSLPYRLRRENGNVLIFTSKSILSYKNQELGVIKNFDNQILIDKNYQGYYLIEK